MKKTEAEQMPVTDAELEEARLAIKNSLLSALDSPAAMQGYYIGGLLKTHQLSPSEAAQTVDRISKERVIELANCVQPDTIFALRGEK